MTPALASLPPDLAPASPISTPLILARVPSRRQASSAEGGSPLAADRKSEINGTRQAGIESPPVDLPRGHPSDCCEVSAPEKGIGGRRRKTLAPPSWDAGCSGSRFSCLGDLVAAPSGLEGEGEDHVAVWVAPETLEEMVPACARQKADHPERSQMEIVQQFWSDAGFPTPARRSSEAVSPANSGKCTDGVHVCRDSKKAELRSRRRLSSSAGVRLKKMPPRMGPWRGPLPPRRISPLPVLGVLIDSAMETRSSSAPQKTTPTAIGVAETMQAAPPFAPGSVESSNRTQSGAHNLATSRNCPDHWAHSRR